LHQKPAGGAAEQIHQENGDVGKYGQAFERADNLYRPSALFSYIVSGL
jgi:hypothetical protein